MPKPTRYDWLLDAVSAGDPAAVRAMLGNGVHPDEMEEEGDSPLMVAAAAGRLDIVKLLVEGGADVNHMSDGSAMPHEFPFVYELFDEAKIEGMSALGYAACYDHRDIFDYLAPRCNKNVQRQGKTIQKARNSYLASLSEEEKEKFLQSTRAEPMSSEEQERQAFLAQHRDLAKYVIFCGLCQSDGLSELPKKLQSHKGIPALRRLFPLRIGKDHLCDKCRADLPNIEEKIRKNKEEVLAQAPPEVRQFLGILDNLEKHSPLLEADDENDE